MAIPDATCFLDLSNRLQVNICSSGDKVDACLETVEKLQLKCMEVPFTLDAEGLQKMRSSLASVHLPLSTLKNDLMLFKELFRERFIELEKNQQACKELHCDLLKEKKIFDEENDRFLIEKLKHDENVTQWKKEILETKRQLAEQSSRLTFLSCELTEKKLQHDRGNQDLVNRRIAFEEQLHNKTNAVKSVSEETEPLEKSLRQQVLKNIQLENLLLHTEVKLHRSEQDIEFLQRTKQRLQLEVDKLRTAASNAIRLVEAKAIQANEKFSAVGQELLTARNSLEQSEKLFVAEKKRHDTLMAMLKSCVKDSPADTLGSAHRYLQSLSDTIDGGNKVQCSKMKPGDLARKYEVLLVENTALKATVKKLRIENCDLMKCLKHANSNSSSLRNQVLTSIHERGELMKRLNQMDHKYHELKFLLSKGNEHVVKKMHLKKEIQAVSVLGGSKRTWTSSKK